MGQIGYSESISFEDIEQKEKENDKVAESVESEKEEQE